MRMSHIAEFACFIILFIKLKKSLQHKFYCNPFKQPRFNLQFLLEFTKHQLLNRVTYTQQQLR